MAVTFAIGKIIEAIEHTVNALKYAKEAFEESQQELESLNSELNTTKLRIEELQNLDKLTITEEDELKKLKLQNQLLELQIENQKKLNEEKAKEFGEKNQKDYTKKYGTLDRNNVDKYAEQLNSVVDGRTSASFASNSQIEADLGHYLYAKKELAEAVTDEDKELYEESVREWEEKIHTIEADTIEAMQNALDAGDTTFYEELKNNLKYMYEITEDTSRWNTDIFNQLFSTEGVEDSKDDLISLARAGKLTADDLSDNLKDVANNADWLKVDDKIQTVIDQLYGLADTSRSTQNIKDIASATEKYATKYQDSPYGGGFKYIANKAENEEFNSWIRTLSEEDADLVANSSVFEQAFNRRKKALGETATAAEVATKALEDTQHVIQNSGKIEFDQKGFAESMDNLSSLSALYLKFRDEAEDNPIYVPFDIKDIEGLREKWEEYVGKEIFDDFERTLTSESSTIDEVQAKFDNLATRYVNSQLDMRGATAETAEMVQTQLEKQGLLSDKVRDYVNEATVLAITERSVATALANTGQIEDVNIANLKKETETLNLTNEELLRYIMMSAQASGITITGDASWLISFCNQLGATADEANYLISVLGVLQNSITGTHLYNSGMISKKDTMGIPTSAINGMKEYADGTERADRKAQEFDKSLEKLRENLKDTGGAAKDTAEDTVDILSKINSQIDEIQDSYQKLEKIQEDYNSTGKISIDQAQELSNMDFRYLAILDTTAGQLDLNKDKWDDLTQAKINDLKIAMIQKALDLISTFKNEATAIEYLKNTYIDASNAALTFLDAQAQVEAMHLGEEGQKAADQVMLGLQNALNMMDNIDLNLHVDKESGHEGVDHSSSEHGGKTPEQEAFEEEVKEAEEKINVSYKDWVEVALERVSRKVEKWTKSVDKLFSFWNKQWALNKAISGVQEQREMQKAAAKIYMKQASKAAKKAGRYIDKNDEELTFEIKGTEGLSNAMKKLATRGAMKITEYKSDQKSKTALAKLEAFMEWANKALEAEKQIEELYEQEKELLRQKLNAIVEYFDTLDGYLQTTLGKLDAYATMKGAAGVPLTLKDLMDQYKANNDILRNKLEALFAVATGESNKTARTVDQVQSEINLSAITTSNSEDMVAELQKRNDAFNTIQKELVEQTSADQIAALEKEANQLKLSNAETSVLSSANVLKDNMAKLATIISNAQGAVLDQSVDGLIASNATYGKLLKKITKLQNKKANSKKGKLSKKNQKKLDKLYAELNSVNQGVLEEDLASYMKDYEAWYKLEQEKTKKEGKGKSLSAKKQVKYDRLSKQLQEYSDKYEAHQADLVKQKERATLIESIDKYDRYGDIEGYKELIDEYQKQQIDEANELYDDRIKDVQDSYTDLKAYKKLEKQAAKANKKNPNSKKAKKLQAKIEALKEGATRENYNEYAKTWEEWYDLEQLRTKGVSINTERYEKLRAKLDEWNQAKQDELAEIQYERNDYIETLQRENQQKIEEFQTQVYEANAKAYEQIKSIIEYDLNVLQRYIDMLDAQINRFKQVASILENVSTADIFSHSGLADFLGINDTDVTTQIRNQLSSAVQLANEKIQKLTGKGNVYKDLIAAGNSANYSEVIKNLEDKYKSQFAGEYETTYKQMFSDISTKLTRAQELGQQTDWVAEWEQGLTGVVSELGSALTEIQAIRDEVREQVFLKPIKEMITQLDAVKSRIESMSGLIKDDWLFDVDGITEFGLAKAAILADDYAVAQQQMQNYAEQVRKIDEAHANGDAKYKDDETYWQARNEAMGQYYQQMQNVEGIATQLYELSKKQQEAEINRLKKLVDVRQKALQSKKAYWDYNNRIKNAQKEVEVLQAEIDALSNIDSAEKKALLAQKTADLDAAKKALEDMQTEHAFDLSNEALQKFVDDLQNEFDTSTQEIDKTFDKFLEGLQSTLEMAKTADVADTLTKISQVITGGDGSINFTNDTSVSSSGNAQTDFNTASIKTEQYVGMDEATFISSLKSTVVPSMDTANATLKSISTTLTSISQNLVNSGSTQWIQKIHDTLAKSLQPNISQIADLMKDNGGKQDITVNVNYDSLINVQGSIDATVVKDMQKFTDDCINKTKESIYKDLRKNGVNIKY